MGLRRTRQALEVGVLLACLCACSRGTPEPRKLNEALAHKALVTYADIASAAYTDALVGSRALEAAVRAFTAAPTEQALRAAREAWRAARVPYLQTEVYRFYEGPIDRVELLVNTWPIDESYVEGVIDDGARYASLDQALLVSLNARDGETSISTGYHVIEFLLWGRDGSDDGPGARSASEFVGDGVAARRRSYLELACALLNEHLAQVVEAWRDAPRSYRAELLQMPPKQALGLVLKGMGTFSGPELSGERLTVPYETRDQENEQSCFSDTTHEDIVLDARGVENVCFGRYARSDAKVVSGTGICALIDDVDAALGAQLRKQISTSAASATKIPAPFDRALTGSDSAPGRSAIKATIDALQAQTDSIARAAALLDVRASKP